MFDSLDISASALLAQRTRMDTIAQNVASMNVTRNAAGQAEPYRRRFVVFAPGTQANPAAPGVHVASIEADNSHFREVYEPTNPLADDKGIVRYPNVDMAIESVNMIEASRAYEANVTMMEVQKSMINSALRLLV
jgi:flagellar basal-body rod protein FlgC